MVPIADMDCDQTRVTARLSAKISAEESQNALSDAVFEVVVFTIRKIAVGHAFKRVTRVS